jgi:hypothetical protein
MGKVSYKVSHEEILDFKKRRFCRLHAYKALKKGQITKDEKCHVCKCKTEALNAHHIDYGKPLEVLWICDDCHHVVHLKDHPLNPNNNPQTKMGVEGKKWDTVNVTFILPVAHFMEILEAADRENKSVSAIVKQEVVKAFPIQEKKENKNVNTQNVKVKRVRGMAQNESLLPKPECAVLPKVRGARNWNLQQVDDFCSLSGRHGQDARQLQRA